MRASGGVEESAREIGGVCDYFFLPFVAGPKRGERNDGDYSTPQGWYVDSGSDVQANAHPDATVHP